MYYLDTFEVSFCKNLVLIFNAEESKNLIGLPLQNYHNFIGLQGMHASSSHIQPFRSANNEIVSNINADAS